MESIHWICCCMKKKRNTGCRFSYFFWDICGGEEASVYATYTRKLLLGQFKMTKTFPPVTPAAANIHFEVVVGGNKCSIYKSGKVTLQEYRLWCAAETVGVSALFDRVAHHVLLWLANSAAPEVLCEPVTGGADSDLQAGSLWHRGSKVAGETACICSSMLVKNEKCLNRFSGSTCMCDIWLNEVSSNWIMSRAIFFLPNFVHALSGMCVVWHKTHTWTRISYNFKSWNTHLANKLGFSPYNNVVRKHLRIKKNKQNSVCLKTW